VKRTILGAGLGAITLVGGLVVGTVAALPASAAPSTQTLDCGSAGTLLVRTNTNNSSDNGGWSVAQVLPGGSGHLIPTSFVFSAYDDTTQQPLFSFTQPKGNGHANHNQQTVFCSSTQTGVLADLLDPGEQPPPGAALTDIVTVTFGATAVPKL
jgi:hypothetical protein